MGGAIPRVQPDAAAFRPGRRIASAIHANRSIASQPKPNGDLVVQPCPDRRADRIRYAHHHSDANRNGDSAAACDAGGSQANQTARLTDKMNSRNYERKNDTPKP